MKTPVFKPGSALSNQSQEIRDCYTNYLKGYKCGLEHLAHLAPAPSRLSDAEIKKDFLFLFLRFYLQHNKSPSLAACLDFSEIAGWVMARCHFKSDHILGQWEIKTVYDRFFAAAFLKFDYKLELLVYDFNFSINDSGFRGFKNTESLLRARSKFKQAFVDHCLFEAPCIYTIFWRLSSGCDDPIFDCIAWNKQKFIKKVPELGLTIERTQRHIALLHHGKSFYNLCTQKKEMNWQDLYPDYSLELLVDCKQKLAGNATPIQQDRLDSYFTQQFNEGIVGRIKVKKNITCPSYQKFLNLFKKFATNLVVLEATRKKSAPERIDLATAAVSFIEDCSQHIQKGLEKDSVNLFPAEPTSAKQDSVDKRIVEIKNAVGSLLQFKGSSSDKALGVETTLIESSENISRVYKVLLKLTDIIIFSFEHPGLPIANFNLIARFATELKTKGWRFDICKGAYRYSIGPHKGEVIEEISLVCYAPSNPDLKFIARHLTEFKQESFIHVTQTGAANLVCGENLKKSFIGFWRECHPKKVSELEEGQGFSVIDGKYYVAEREAEETKMEPAA